MDADEVAIHEMKGDRIRMIVDFLTESVRQASEAAHVHSHGKVLPLNVAGADVFGVRVSAHGFHVATDTNRWRVARLVFKRCAVNLVQLGVVHIGSKGALYCVQICLVTVGGDLYAILDSAGAIFHEISRPVCATPTDEVTDNELRVCVDSYPSPNVAPSNFFFLGADVFGFRSDVCPYFVTLETADRHIANMFIMEPHTGLAEINKQFGHCIASHTCHARSCTDAVPFDQCSHDSNPLILSELIHNEQLCLSIVVQSSIFFNLFLAIRRAMYYFRVWDLDFRSLGDFLRTHYPRAADWYIMARHGQTPVRSARLTTMEAAWI